MAVYKRGSQGDEVRKIQKKLQALGFYQGPIDGDFGGGTYGAVKTFQKDRGLQVDGKVGPNTWKSLFNKKIPKPELHDERLIVRCLSLTSTFETGKGIPDGFSGLSGDFDGQGISFGILQWNFGQNSLQPLLRKMIKKHPDVMKNVFQEQFLVLKEAAKENKADPQGQKEEAMAFARGIQHSVRHFVFQPWKGMFKALGRVLEYQKIQIVEAGKLFSKGLDMCREYKVRSERAAALMFDLKVQNGSIRSITRQEIFAAFDELGDHLTDEEREVKKLRIIANKRAEAANSQWVEDVRKRKLCIANGGGEVHHTLYDLEEQYGITLKPYKKN